MRVTFTCGILAIASFTFVVRADSTTEDAQARLAAREAQRQNERRQLVQITAGELSDLRNRLKMLEGEVATLRDRAATKDPSKNKPIPTMIEIGMTKAEVMLFVKRTRGLQITSMSADAGVQRSTVKVNKKGNATMDENLSISENRQPSKGIRVEGDLDQTSKAEVERVTSVGLHETLHIVKSESYRVVTGSHTGGLGNVENEYGDASRITGNINVELTDGFVTSVTAQ